MVERINRKFRTGMVIAMLSSALLVSAGCLVTANSNTQTSGRPIIKSLASHIEVGKTTKEDALTLLGQPTSESKNDNGMEVLRYRYSETKTNNSVFIFLWACSSEDKKSDEVVLVFKNDILQSYSRD